MHSSSLLSSSTQSNESVSRCPLRVLVGPGSVKYRSYWLLVSIALFVVDQKLKNWALLSAVDPINLLPKVLQIHLTHNTGLAFGLLGTWPQSALMASSVLTVALILYAWKRLSIDEQISSLPVWLFLALMTAGAMGNTWDRWSRGAVVDFIDVMVIHFPVFNAADVFVCLGVSGILYSLLKPTAHLGQTGQ